MTVATATIRVLVADDHHVVRAGVAALLGLAGRRVTLLRRVAVLLGWISTPLVGCSLRVGAPAHLVLRTPVAVVVVLVAGSARSLTPAVARIVSHCCYSSFFAERVI